MSAPEPDRLDDAASEMLRDVGAAGRRMEEYRRSGEASVWTSLRLIGGVGWTIALPTVGGALLGRWLDGWCGCHPQWTAALTLAGLGLGCVAAWIGIDRSLQV